MREVIYRRFSRAYQEEDAIRAGELVPEKARFLPLPDLILVDGGRGHVSAIQQLMDTLGEDIPIYGLVKDDKHRTRALTGSQQEFELDEDGSLFKFLSRMQDEVHRFAITQFRKRYEKENVCSELEKIRGIGAVKRKKLLETFISIARIKSASEEELCQVVDAATARRIIDYFKEDR